jgi:hypothetical protein
LPILFACPECGNRLQVRDELARQRVACPDCRALLTAPAPENTPATDAVPVAEVVAPAKRAKAAAPEEPVVVLEEAEAPHAHRKVWELDGDAKKPVMVRRFDQLSGTAVRWSGFASGCWLVKIGNWVELGGVVLLVLAVQMTLIGIASQTKWLMVVNWAGPFFAVPLWVLLFTGSVMGAVGRFRMLALPADTSAGGILRGSLILSGFKVTAVIGALIFAMLSGTEWTNNQSGGMVRYGLYALIAHALAVVAGRILDVSSVPAMAVIGGEIPNVLLRSRAAMVALVFQIVATVWVGLGILVYYFAIAVRGLDVVLRPAAPAAAPVGNEPLPDRETGLLAIGTVFGIILAIEIAYTWLNASLYAAAEGAAAGVDDGSDESPE